MRYYFIIILLMIFTSTSAVCADDSAFDSDGCYYPLELFDINGLWIERLDVTTIGNDTEVNKVDRARFGSPEIFVVLTRRNVISDIMFRCVDAAVEPERFHAVCKNTLIGDITFNGEFIDKRGQYWDHASDSETPVLKAIVTVNMHGKVIHEREYIFGYREGD
jgi:hypothetical protein